VVVVPGQQPGESSEAAELTETVHVSPPIWPAISLTPSVYLPTGRTTAVRSAVSRLVLLIGLAGAAVAALALVMGQDLLLVLQLKTPTFVAYQGASAEQVRFVMNDGFGQTAAVPGALLLDWREGQAQPAMRLTMGNPAAEPEVERLAADGVSVEEIRYRGAWPGIDAVIRTMPGGWSCNFIVEPGVDPGVIELEYVGATALTIDPAGRLHVRAPGGVWIDGTPESWQDGPSGREPVGSGFALHGGGRFGFVVGPYDPSRPLVVDPPSERSF